ncbi:leader peptidase (prepilin peptidase)/N-methyltransferase [Rhizobium sp. SG741]|nr:leader peptidase (prepilin peptidase)/N-methyltransferase [Rhizobium sp. SG741]
MADLLQFGFLATISAIICWEDIRRFRIPDLANALLFAGGLGVRLSQGWYAMSVGALNACVVFVCVLTLRNALTKLRGRSALGMGDVKLMAASSVWLDLSDIPCFVLIACCSALVFVAVTFRSVDGSVADRRIPFGPFLCLSLLMTWAMEHLRPLNLG